MTEDQPFEEGITKQKSKPNRKGSPSYIQASLATGGKKKEQKRGGARDAITRTTLMHRGGHTQKGSRERVLTGKASWAGGGETISMLGGLTIEKEGETGRKEPMKILCQKGRTEKGDPSILKKLLCS